MIKDPDIDIRPYIILLTQTQDKVFLFLLYIKNCNNKKLNDIIRGIEDNKTKLQDLILKFIEITYNTDKYTKFNLEEISKNSNNIKRFWYLLYDIYNNKIPSITEYLCNQSIGDNKNIHETKINVNTEITLNELDTYKRKLLKLKK